MCWVCIHSACQYHVPHCIMRFSKCCVNHGTYPGVGFEPEPKGPQDNVAGVPLGRRPQRVERADAGLGGSLGLEVEEAAGAATVCEEDALKYAPESS